ncbi:MAG: serpin family protein [Candidatus Omnitrophota bacterium]
MSKFFTTMSLAVVAFVLMLTAVVPMARAAGNTADFAFDLYARHEGDRGNVFFSPYSLSSALGMTLEGARDKTAAQMIQVLGLDADPVARLGKAKALLSRMNTAGKPYELSTANALWIQQDFMILDDYLGLVRDVYAGEASALDFAADAEGARLTINSWVMERTHQRIKDLIPSGALNPATRMVLTNAVYFKGKWDQPFEKEQTLPEAFQLAGGEQVTADMMHASHGALFMEDDMVQMLELPYQGNDLVMRIILPKNGPGLFPQGLNTARLAQWSAALKMVEPVDIALPKFTFGASYVLNDDLVALGMTDAFDASVADFSAMTGGKDLFIGKVLHKAWVEVSEEGTEAAAATAVMMVGKGMPPPPKVFHADHPFIFLIQDKVSGEILFMGRVMDPTKG